MYAHTNMGKMAAGCIVLGIAGALSSVSGEASKGTEPVYQAQTSDICAVAASFGGDNKQYSAALRSAAGCSPAKTNR